MPARRAFTQERGPTHAHSVHFTHETHIHNFGRVRPTYHIQVHLTSKIFLNILFATGIYYSRSEFTIHSKTLFTKNHFSRKGQSNPFIVQILLQNIIRDRNLLFTAGIHYSLGKHYSRKTHSLFRKITIFAKITFQFDKSIFTSLLHARANFQSKTINIQFKIT